MSGRTYPYRRIRMTAEELQTERDNWNRDGERNGRDREQEREIAELKRETERKMLQEKLNQMQTGAPSPQRERDFEKEERAASPLQPGRAKPGSGRKGPREGTLAAGAAVHSYLKDKGDNPKLTPASLAQKAADYATKLGLPDADLLSPEGSTLRQMAQSLLVAHRWKGK